MSTIEVAMTRILGLPANIHGLDKLLLTPFVPAAGGISPLIVYHVTTTGRNRVKLCLLEMVSIATLGILATRMVPTAE